MSENENRYVVQLTTTDESQYWMRDKELTSRVSTLENITYGHKGEFSEKTTNITGIAALPENSESVDPGEIKLIVADGEQAAAYDSEGNVWTRAINGDDVTWTNKWEDKLDKPGNNDSYVLTSVYTDAQIGEPPEGTEENLWDLIMELQERIRLLEAGQKNLTGVNFDIDADTAGYKLILILGDNTNFDDNSGIGIADKVEQKLQENNIGVVWLKNDSSIDLYKQLNLYSTSYDSDGKPNGDPAIYIKADDNEMILSSIMRDYFYNAIIPLSNFALIIFIANGGDLNNANRYGSSSGNYNYIGGAINPNDIKINVQEYEEMRIYVRINAPNGGITSPEYAWKPENEADKENFAYQTVKVPKTIASSVNTVYAMEASVLKLVQTAAPNSVIRVVNPITWNINGNTDTTAAYQSAKTTLLSSLKTFCTNYGYVFKEIYSINDNNRKTTMDLASKTVTSTSAINNYILGLCGVINESIGLSTIIVRTTDGNKSGYLGWKNTKTVKPGIPAQSWSLKTASDSHEFNIPANGDYTLTFTYVIGVGTKTEGLTSHSASMILKVYKNGTEFATTSSNNDTISLTDCVAGDKIKYIVTSSGSVNIPSSEGAESSIVYTIAERNKWAVDFSVVAPTENS